MKIGSLFSGIGGFDLGLERSGMSIADGPRYCMLGNAVAVPVAEWLGFRIQLVEVFNQ